MVRKLIITKDADGGFTVDEPAAPGMPPVGRGRTMNAAIGSWFLNHSKDLGFTIGSEGDAIQSVERAKQRELSKR